MRGGGDSGPIRPPHLLTTHTNIHKRAHAHTHTNAYTHTRTHGHTHTHTHTCMHTRSHTFTQTHTHTHASAYQRSTSCADGVAVVPVQIIRGERRLDVIVPRHVGASLPPQARKGGWHHERPFAMGQDSGGKTPMGSGMAERGGLGEESSPLSKLHLRDVPARAAREGLVGGRSDHAIAK